MAIKYVFEDRASFKAKFGEDLFNRYMAIRQRISDTDWKDMDKVTRFKSADELEDYINNFQSGEDLKRIAKQGAKLITSENGWKVYKINTYEASTYYGRDTRWCICGTTEEVLENGKTPRETFEEYDEMVDMYFYIKGNKKYCVAYFSRGGNRGTLQIFDEQNKFVALDELPKDLPEINHIVGGGFPHLIYDNELDAIKETMKAFDFQHNGSYMFAFDWFERGEIELKGGVKHCIEVLLDSGYCIVSSGSTFSIRKGYNGNMDLDELEVRCESRVDKAKKVVNQYWDEANNAFIIGAGERQFNPAEKNAFKTLGNGGFKFYDWDENGHVAVCTMDRKYKQIANKIDVYDFFALCGERVEAPQETEADVAKRTLKKYWDSANSAFIIKIGRNHLTMDEMDAFEVLYDEGFDFYDCDNYQVGHIAICSEDTRYSQIAEEVTINEFFTLCR